MKVGNGMICPCSGLLGRGCDGVRGAVFGPFLVSFGRVLILVCSRLPRSFAGRKALNGVLSSGCCGTVRGSVCNKLGLGVVESGGFSCLGSRRMVILNGDLASRVGLPRFPV